MEAFYALHQARTYGAAAPNAIPVSEILALCALEGIASGAERRKYQRLIQMLDGEWLKFWSDSQPKAPPTSKRKG